MSETVIRSMESSDEYFVGTCTHVDEGEEMDACGQRRIAHLLNLQAEGLRVKVALKNGKRVGFAYVLPIEISPWGPLGEELMVMPCFFVRWDVQKSGVGSALLAAVEAVTREAGAKGVATIAYDHDFWFMPLSFFQNRGFAVATRRGKEVVAWKAFDPTARAPRLLEPHFDFEPVPGKVAVDLLWNQFCLTSAMEAQRVREVVAELGDRVVLRELASDDRQGLLCYETPRAIYVDGKAIGWGHEAPREGIRKAIDEAISAL